jgi:hypothetical protein
MNFIDDGTIPLSKTSANLYMLFLATVVLEICQLSVSIQWINCRSGKHYFQTFISNLSSLLDEKSKSKYEAQCGF